MTEDEQSILTDLQALELGLTDWEVEFIESLERRREAYLTPGQKTKLLQLAEERL